MGHDRFDLNQGTHGQSGSLDNRPCRNVANGPGDGRVREEGRVDLVDSVDVREVLEEDRDLDDVVEGNVDARQDRLYVGEALLGLLLDAADDDLAGLRVDRQLSRHVVVIREGHVLLGRGLRGALSVFHTTLTRSPPAAHSGSCLTVRE